MYGLHYTSIGQSCSRTSRKPTDTIRTNRFWYSSMTNKINIKKTKGLPIHEQTS